MIIPTVRLLLTVGLIACTGNAVAYASGKEVSDTQSVQAELKSKTEQLNAARKQVSLKQATVDVTQSRITELESQLQVFRKRMSEQTAGLKAAEAEAAKSEANVQQLQSELQRHLYADELVAAAAAVKCELNASTARQTELQSSLDNLAATISDQQQQHEVAATRLKKISEELPTTLMQLSAARITLDELNQKVAEARLRAHENEQELLQREEQLVPKLRNSRHAAAAFEQVSASIKALKLSIATVKEAEEKANANTETATEIAVAVDAIEALRKRSEELVKATSLEQQQAKREVEAAEQSLATASDQLKTLQSQNGDQAQKHFRLQLAVATLQASQRSYHKVMSDTTTEIEQLKRQQTETTTRLNDTQVIIRQLTETFESKQQAAEAELETLGRFVSFSKHVAPILAKHCLACHNEDTNGGQLNLESFTVLLRGGKSGKAIEPGHPERSMLLERTGGSCMPKDAAPLAADEVAVLRKWIHLGASLDAGTTPTATLFEIMPEQPQPLPPETYRVPIPVTATALNADGRLLASSGYHEVLIWNVADSKLLRRINNLAERIYDLEFTADGQHLIIAAGTLGQVGEVKVFSAIDGTHENTLVRTRDAMFAVSISPNGKLIAAAGAGGRLYVANLESGELLLNSKTHADWILDVNWSPDGTRLVTASRDKTARLLSVNDARVIHTFIAHNEPLATAVFTPDGNSIASAGGDSQIRIWNTADANEVRSISGFGSEIFRLTMTPENRLLSASADRNAREHQITDGKLVRTFAGHSDWVYALSYCPSKKLIATGSYDGEIRVWNAEDGSVETSFIAIPNALPAAAVAATTTLK